MSDLYGIADDPLPADKLQELKSVAQSQVDGTHSNYYTTTNYTAPDPAKYPNSVLYFDLQGSAVGDTVNLNKLANTWEQNPTTCATRSLMIIIDNGNLKLNGNGGTAATIVLTSKTYGNVDKANGTADLVGSIYANTISLAGNAGFKMDTCFLGNLSPSLYSLETRNYLELDR